MISVVQCPYCGWFQASIASKSFKCRKCGKSKALRHVKIIKVVPDPVTARALVQALRSQSLSDQ